MTKENIIDLIKSKKELFEFLALRSQSVNSNDERFINYLDGKKDAYNLSVTVMNDILEFIERFWKV